MKYMVMECHYSYAVVLDEDGRFLYVANKHYQVGQMVTDVIEMQDAQPDAQPTLKNHYKWIGPIAAMAACLVLIAAAVFQWGANRPYASVYMSINPQVRIDVNKQDVVVDVEGINQDGKILVEDYSYKKKNLDFVMDELVDRAIAMGFLHEGGQITLTLDANDGEWIVTKGDSLNTHLNGYLTDKLSVTIEITNGAPANTGVTIPLGPDNTPAATHYGESDYAQPTPTAVTPTPANTAAPDDDPDTDYNSNSDGDTDYGDYGTAAPVSPTPAYADTDYGPESDGATDYEDVYGSDDSNYGTNDDIDDDADDDD